ncbi:hypothetical protein L218DRAFT_901080 [Marasmius fiardii PR-910]|nr:hypothetical protein L218DRAFT_901080 [Marasmius fiardii PR-910]
MPAERSNGKVKRPPNAWILFRSDVARAIAQDEELHPERPRKTQAQISKEISSLWSSLDPERKQEYDRRAEAKKHEHSMLYPGYRFQPMKKEEKERQKQLKKQKDREERYKQRVTDAVASGSRAQSVNPSPVSPPIPLPGAAHLLNLPTPPPSSISQPPSQLHQPVSSTHSPSNLEADPAGPSPPLLAADSPYDTTISGGDSQQETTLQPPPLELSPALSTQNADEMTQSLMSPLPDNSWTLPLSDGESIPLNTTELLSTSWQGSPEQSTSQPSYLTLDIPQTAWNADGMAMFDESMQALLTSSGDPSIFHLNNVDPQILDMGAPLDISVGDLNVDLSMFSYAEWADVLAQYVPNDNLPPFDGNVGSTTHDDTRTPSNPLSSHSAEFEDSLSRYVDLDGGSFSHQPSLTPAEAQSPLPQTHSPGSESSEASSSRSTFVPPTYSNQRKPGGTWKPPTTFGEVTVQPWKVRAS